jgi:glutathione synthase
MRISVQLDEVLNPETDTSLFLCEEAFNQGYEVCTFHPSSLNYHNGELQVKASRWKTSDTFFLDLNTLDVILVRQNPPFDFDYFSNTCLLDQAKALVLNSPSGLRLVSEKLATLSFPEFIPPTLITYQEEQVRSFIQENSLAILKPLFEFGGHNISKITAQNAQEALSDFKKKCAGPFLVQKFLPEVEEDGDKRIFILNGKPIIGFRRIPKKGNFLANLCQEAEALPYKISNEDLKIATLIGKWLKDKGIFLAGIDMIGPYLIEINVTSPTGFRTVQNLYDINLARLFWEEVEGIR